MIGSRAQLMTGREGRFDGNLIPWLCCSVAPLKTTTAQDGSGHVSDILALFCTVGEMGDMSSMFLTQFAV